MSVIVAYLLVGAAGAPVFALGKSGFSFGPTSGYLIGMIFSSFCMGYLADLGWTSSFKKSWLAAFLGSVITFTFGALVLSFFIPKDAVLMAGVLPFIPGDIIKTILSSYLANRFKLTMEKN